MKLLRKELVDYENCWIKEHPNKNSNPKEYLSFLDGLEEIIESREYEPDVRFVNYGRGDLLCKEFTDYLNGNAYAGRGKYNDAFVDLAEFYSENKWLYRGTVPPELNFHKIDDDFASYKRDGVICSQEVEIIKDMINEFRNHLNNDEGGKMNLNIEDKINYAKIKYEELGYSNYEFKTERHDEINADLVWIDLRGPGALLIADNGEYLFCPSLYSTEHCIEEFKKGVRTGTFGLNNE